MCPWRKKSLLLPSYNPRINIGPVWEPHPAPCQPKEFLAPACLGLLHCQHKILPAKHHNPAEMCVLKVFETFNLTNNKPTIRARDTPCLC